VRGSSYDRPTSLGRLLDLVVRRRGIAEKSGQRDLNTMWAEVAGERIGERSSVRRLRNGVLEIGVRNGAVLEELSSYLKHDLLISIRTKHTDLNIQSLKFVRVR
jgi:predicted nucleic acid-binding Zn ribbon protein